MSDKTSSPAPKLPLKTRLAELGQKATRHWLLLLALLFVILYGFVAFNFWRFSQQQPTALQVSNDTKSAPQANINPKIVKQINQLQNNSVSVQALFNQARQNPFQ